MTHSCLHTAADAAVADPSVVAATRPLKAGRSWTLKTLAERGRRRLRRSPRVAVLAAWTPKQTEACAAATYWPTWSGRSETGPGYVARQRRRGRHRIVGAHTVASWPTDSGAKWGQHEHECKVSALPNSRESSLAGANRSLRALDSFLGGSWAAHKEACRRPAVPSKNSAAAMKAHCPWQAGSPAGHATWTSTFPTSSLAAKGGRVDWAASQGACTMEWAHAPGLCGLALGQTHTRQCPRKRFPPHHMSCCRVSLACSPSSSLAVPPGWCGRFG